MPTIVFCSTKGGVGKSTSALVLSQVLAQHGSKVKIIDTDPNQPIADEWWENASPSYPLNIDVQGGVNENTIIDVIDEAANTHSFVIVDLEGSANITASYAISRSDMVIIPMAGTKLDSREAAKVISFIAREGKARRSDIPYRIMFSKCSVIQTREEKEIRRELIEAKLPVLAHGMMNKAAFSSIFGFGCTLYQLNKQDVSNAESAIENAEQVATDIVQALKFEGGNVMTKERKPTFSVLNNLSTVEPTTKAPRRDKQDIDKIAQQSGFTTRHASFENSKDAILTKYGYVDGRSKRRSVRTNRTTLAIRPDVDEEFRALAEKLTPPGQNLLTLGDVLEFLIRHYKDSVKS